MFCVFLDQISKFLVKEPFRNYFFAFSIQLPAWVMYGIYVIAIALIVRYIFKNFFAIVFFNKLAWILILSGASSNVVERLVLGYVRDFIYIYLFRWVGIYNLADGYIILGIIILLFPLSHKPRLQSPDAQVDGRQVKLKS